MSHTIEITPIDDQSPLIHHAKEDESFKKVRLEEWHIILRLPKWIISCLHQTSANEATEYEKQEGRKAHYLIEMKETKGEDQSGLQANKSSKQIFDERLKDLNNRSTKSCTIFRVTVGLSESNPDAYKPKLISIGPYHSKNPELSSMEKYKLKYLERFLRRKEGIDVEMCISELEILKDEALKCYDNLEDLDSDHHQFLQMLLLDSCFVVEYVREFCGIIPTGEDTVIKVGCIDNQVRRDLLLIENQLPFFVLTKLHDMTKKDDEIFTIMAKFTFLPSLPKITPASFLPSLPKITPASLLPSLPKITPASFLIMEGNVENIKHLLHLVHMSCYPSEMKPSISRNSSMRGVEHCRKSLCWNLSQKIRSREIQIDEKHLTWHDIMTNATELCEAGVSFTKVGAIYRCVDEDNLGDNTSLFDINFENGLMKIPCFEVVDDTETILRNLIAYEQQSSNLHPTYFSDYAIFMDHLIDSEKDVNLLRLKGIIRNRIGEDKEVASFFNKLGKGVSVSSNFYYKEECRKVVQHCEKPWNRMKANLRRNYFHSPWAGISTVAAITLLLLTATQAVLAFISIIK